MDNEYYVGAPYNFIELNKKVYEKKKLQPHDVMEPQKHTGVIEYEVEAKTPIMIDDGTRQFYRNIYGKAAIPGSTMRGLIRNNMQILSFSSAAYDIQNGKLMYRNVAAGKEKDYYNEVLGNKTKQDTLPNGKKVRMSVLKNVKAGYLRNTGNHYHIIPTVVDSISKETGAMNYYVLNERKIMEEKGDNFSFLKQQNPWILQHKNAPFKHDTDRKGRDHYKGEQNPFYHPYFMKVSYELAGTRQVTGIDEWGKLSHNGYLMSTGKMQEKKAVYVIPEMDESKEWISVPGQDIDDFKRDYEGRKNQVEAMEGEKKGSFHLPKNGETKPVFYIQLGKKLYFGFTPRLRLFYDKEIHDGMSTAYRNVKQDYCRSLFGYTDREDKNSYKSRVCFMDAEVIKGKKADHGIDLVLGAPKPTSYLDYLTSANHKSVTYNGDFQLRGIKQYWLKEKPDQPASVKNLKIASQFCPYEDGSVFKGKIRFENLSDEELGMLLWSLVLEKESNQNIGKAKSYGYGRIGVKLTGLNLLDYEKLYQTSGLAVNPYEDCTEKAKDYIRMAKADMTAFLGHDVMTDTRIRHFFMMKDASRIPNEEATQYMSIDHKDYQRRMQADVMLPTVEDVMTGKPFKHTLEKRNNHYSGGRKNAGGKGKQNHGKSENHQNSLGYCPFANINLNGDKKH